MKKMGILIALITALVLILGGCASSGAAAKPAEPAVTVLMSTTFEDGDIGAWGPRGGGESLEVIPGIGQDSGSALFVSGRTAGWNGAAFNASDIMAPGGTYQISFYTKYDEGSATDSVTLSIQKTIDGAQSWANVIKVDLKQGEWKKVDTTFDMPEEGDILMYLEAGNADLTYFIDDFTISSGSAVATEGPDLSAYPKLKAAQGTVEIDAKIDDIWNTVEANSFGIIDGTVEEGSTFKVLWDKDFVYVLFDVKDTDLNDASTADHEQDSVEIFIDQNNSRKGSYDKDDEQFRVNYKNKQSFNGNTSGQGSFTTKSRLNDQGYIIEAAMPLNVVPGVAGALIGFDVQINYADASATRTGTANWANATGMGWTTMKDLGVLELAK